MATLPWAPSCWSPALGGLEPGALPECPAWFSVQSLTKLLAAPGRALGGSKRLLHPVVYQRPALRGLRSAHTY